LAVLIAAAGLAMPAAPVFAATDAWDGKTIDVSWFTPGQAEYHISTPAQLMGLAALVNGIYNAEITNVIGNTAYIVDNVKEGTEKAGSQNQATTTWHQGSYDFSGQTVYIDANLDMGGAGNFMPIGGQYLMRPNIYSTKISASFCGVLDGQGHWVKNIRCLRRCTTGNFGDGESIGLVGRLGVHDNDPVELWPLSPAVLNVAVTGYISGNRSVGGIVGKIGKTKAPTDGSSTGSAKISNCASFVEISTTDKKGVGGIVGASWNGGTVSNCFNAGKISGGQPAGGIVGSNENKIENCYNIGVVSGPKDYAMAIGTNNLGSDGRWATIVTNTYYLEGTGQDGGWFDGQSADPKFVNAGAKSEADIKAAAFVTTLGAAFAADTPGINGGYPILLWMVANPGTDISDSAGIDKTEWVPTFAVTEATGSVDGGPAVYTGKETEGVVFHIDAPTALLYTVFLNGEELALGTDYTVADDMADVTLLPAFFKNLENGKSYELKALFKGDKYVTLSFTLKLAVEKARLPISAKTVYMKKGTKLTLPAYADMADGRALAARAAKLTWKSSKTGVVKADAKSGKLTAKKAGTATVTAMDADGAKVLSVKVKVVAKASAVTGLKFTKKSLTLDSKSATKNTAALQVKLTPAKAALSGKGVTFESSNENKVEVDAGGRVVGLKKGTATITAKAGGKTATIKVTVK
jgi:hypothetical protein